MAGNFVWTVDDMLVAIGVLALGKQTLGKVKGKRRTERECDWHDWVRAGNRRRVERRVVSWQRVTKGSWIRREVDGAFGQRT